MKNKIISIIVICSFFLVLSGCHTYKPVFYENAHYKAVGKEQADKDVTAAMAKADELKLNSKTGKNLKNTAMTVAVGTTSGAVQGMFWGNTWAGIACGAIWGFFIGAFEWMFGSNQPTLIYQNYVNKTLQDEGYDIIGWK